MRRLWPDANSSAVPGPRLRAAGVETVVDAASLAVVGLLEVVAHIPRIYGEYRKLVRPPWSGGRTLPFSRIRRIST